MARQRRSSVGGSASRKEWQGAFSAGARGKPCTHFYLAPRQYFGEDYKEDPIQFQSRDVNLYRYVNNDPTCAIDPNGTERIKVTRLRMDFPSDDNINPPGPHATLMVVFIPHENKVENKDVDGLRVWASESATQSAGASSRVTIVNPNFGGSALSYDNAVGSIVVGLRGGEVGVRYFITFQITTEVSRIPTCFIAGRAIDPDNAPLFVQSIGGNNTRTGPLTRRGRFTVSAVGKFRDRPARGVAYDTLLFTYGVIGSFPPRTAGMVNTEISVIDVRADARGPGLRDPGVVSV
jgi:hypothetical protein